MSEDRDEHRDEPEPIAMHESCELVFTQNEQYAHRAVMVDPRGTVGIVVDPRDWLGSSGEELWCPLHECCVDFVHIEVIDPVSCDAILEEARAEDE